MQSLARGHEKQHTTYDEQSQQFKTRQQTFSHIKQDVKRIRHKKFAVSLDKCFYFLYFHNAVTREQISRLVVYCHLKRYIPKDKEESKSSPCTPNHGNHSPSRATSEQIQTQSILLGTMYSHRGPKPLYK